VLKEGYRWKPTNELNLCRSPDGRENAMLPLHLPLNFDSPIAQRCHSFMLQYCASLSGHEFVEQQKAGYSVLQYDSSDE
jgi:hypothetical protein